MAIAKVERARKAEEAMEVVERRMAAVVVITIEATSSPRTLLPR